MAVIQAKDNNNDNSERIDESLLASIVRFTSDAIYSTTPAGIITSWNAGAEHMYGYNATEIVGKPVFQLIPAEKADEFAELLKRVCNGEQINDFATLKVRKDGLTMDVALTMAIIPDADGNTCGLSCITRDITVEKHMIQQIHAENELLAVTLASIGDGVVATDASGRIALMNGAAESLTEWRREDSEGRPFSEVFRVLDEYTREPAESPIEKAILEGSTITIPRNNVLITRTGLERPISDSVAPIRSRDGRIVGAVLVFRDVTEERRREQALAESEARFRHLAENAADIIFRVRISPELSFEYISPAAFTITGYHPHELSRNMQLLTYIKILMEPELEKEFSNAIVQPYMMQWKHKDSHPIWLEFRLTPIYDSGGKITVIEGIARDFTERRIMEQRLEYLSMHDSLTGMYNRASYEQFITSLAGEQNKLVGVIVCDVDGLKIINDSLGHAAGDQLIKTAAELLTASLKQADLVARTGGDEFAAIMIGLGEDEIYQICRNIRQAVAEANLQDSSIPISLSLGYSAGVLGTRNLKTIIREADDFMYREKFRRRPETRKKIIQTLMKNVENRGLAGKGQSENIRKLVSAFCQELQLSEKMTADIELLAKFHDIGNSGVPDDLFHKHEPLTAEEIEEMRRHCEKGYRIAKASPELSAIAEWINKHHECWDGSGYPFGLEGEAIPQPCRIVAIIEAFDAMINDRPYREAMTLTEAIAELESKAGTQFDPELVTAFVNMFKSKG